MEKNMKKHNSFLCLTSIIALFAITLTTGCTKEGTVGGGLGAAAGAGVGALAGGNTESTLIGAAVGGLLGGVVGESVGEERKERELNEEREMQARQLARERAAANQQIAAAKEANRKLLERWCASCNRKVTLKGARSCPSCGGELITQRYCRECLATFTPNTGVRYCPYCKGGQVLKER